MWEGLEAIGVESLEEGMAGVALCVSWLFGTRQWSIHSEKVQEITLSSEEGEPVLLKRSKWWRACWSGVSALSFLGVLWIVHPWTAYSLLLLGISICIDILIIPWSYGLHVSKER